MTASTGTVRVIRADDRHYWTNEWLTSWQSFPATGNFDLFGNAHGVLVVHNDDIVAPGEGLDAHQHQNMEIVTWVLDGAVAHRDSGGHQVILHPGTLGYMRAGRGITHSERNAAGHRAGTALRVVQMWVAPDTDGLAPAHAEHDFTAALAGGQPVVVASGLPAHAGTGALQIANRFAALHIARPAARQTLTLPAAPYGHLFLARGRARVAGVELGPGDAVRSTDAPALTVTATDDAEVLFWEMHARFDV